MVTDPEVLLVSALALGSLLVLVRRVWERRLLGRELWEVVVSAGLVAAGLAVDSGLVGPRVALQVVVVGLLGVAAVPPLVVLRLRGSVQQHPEASRLPLVVMALSTVLLAVNLLHNQVAPPLEIYSRVLAPVFWGLVALVALVGGLSRTTFAVGALAAFVAMCAPMPFYPAPLAACHVDKCSVFGSLLTGPYASENFISVVAGSALFLAWLLRRDSFAVLAAATAMAALVAAGGRGSLLGLAVGVAAGVLVGRPGAAARVAGWGSGRRFALSLGVAATFAVVSVVLVTGAEADDFSRRGNVWRRGLRFVEDDWLLGAGLSRWDGYGDLAAVSHHYPHSQYLLVLFAGGLLALALFVVTVAVALSSALATPTSPGLTGHLAFLLTVGLVEVVTNPLAVDGLSWVLLAHCLPLVAPARGWPTPALRAGVRQSRSQGHEKVAQT